MIHSSFFANMKQDRAECIQEEYRGVLNGRALMGLLYNEAAILATEAHLSGVRVTLRDWPDYDRFSLTVDLREVRFNRKHDNPILSYINFPKSANLGDVELLAPEEETPQEYAARVMVSVRNTLWPEVKTGGGRR